MFSLNQTILSCFLCDTNMSKNKWLRRDKMKPFIVLDDFLIASKEPSSTCNTVKSDVLPCQLKCRTRGIQIFATNCGIILGWCEIFGSESLTQVAQFMRNLFDSYEGKYIILNKIINLLNK